MIATLSHSYSESQTESTAYRRSNETTCLAETGLAPSFRAPLGARTELGQADDAQNRPLGDGRRVDDFEILGELGEGALAVVYLARQVSLGRFVALKVSAARSVEARTLANLDHDHIVRVFSETLDRGRGLRLLCMQYVPGLSLDRLIGELRGRAGGAWSGRTILEAIDATGPHPGAIDPAALRDRQLLERCDRVEATCWIGARLAEALAYAHAQGVLHRDVKPANILINPYGRPLLADFNLASDLRRAGDAGLFGGSLGFMAPEHLEAFNPEDPTPSRAVDERSDLYSLGVVLFELLVGQSPFAAVDGPPRSAETLRAMAADRRRVAPSGKAIDPDIPPALDRVLRRCLDPDPSRRHHSLENLACDLEGCQELRRIETELPTGPLTRAAVRRPATMFAIAAFLPHLLGSAINISYNALQIVRDLSVAQQDRFFGLVTGYNVVVYPLCLALAYRMAAPVFTTWRALGRSELIADDAVVEARGSALELPLRIAALACVGWMPGGLLFPLALAARSEPSATIGVGVVGHFLASFWISGLVALTYSYFGVEYVALRVVYPRLWVDAHDLHATMAADLGRRESRLTTFQLLATLIPLSGASLLIGLGPEDLSRTFRTLVGALIAIGMVGVGLTHMASRLLTLTLTILIGPPNRARNAAARPRLEPALRRGRGERATNGSPPARA